MTIITAILIFEIITILFSSLVSLAQKGSINDFIARVFVINIVAALIVGFIYLFSKGKF